MEELFAKFIRFFKLFPFHTMHIGSLDEFWWLDADQYLTMWRLCADLVTFDNGNIDEKVEQLADSLLQEHYV